VIPAEFDYTAPATLEEAIGALSQGGEDAKLLAGGHSLIPLMKLRTCATCRGCTVSAGTTAAGGSGR
jgi:carbon-monoxide dehydrogenase medium subunit